ncbi:MAG TPA: bifunctional 2-keto-4-hydroxyglutarate aldolase/2-keto-3-deoxy-6-phosphogluconate aldolase [Pirellulales bacterium]
MTNIEVLSRVLKCGVVAVVRSPDSSKLVQVAEALAAGGVEVLEITFTIPNALKVIEQVADKLGGKVLLGAGTVLDAATARSAILAGAEYVVSPVVKLEVIEMCKRYSRLAMPGAFTPTEILTAWEAGADVVKVFPSEVLGPSYLKAVKAPLPQVRLMPTGGVTLDTAKDFLAAGACALGIGGSLVSAKAIQTNDYAGIESLARQFVKIVDDFRAAAK